MAATVLITGNTYPVKEQLKELGGKWDKENQGWKVPADKADAAKKIVEGAATTNQEKKPFVHHKCKECGCAASRYNPIYRNGICRNCYRDAKEEADMGY